VKDNYFELELEDVINLLTIMAGGDAIRSFVRSSSDQLAQSSCTTFKILHSHSCSLSSVETFDVLL
jgi:hypothetical protein